MRKVFINTRRYNFVISVISGITFAIFLSLISDQAQAASGKNRFYKDAFAQGGYSTANVSVGSKPFLIQYSVGFSFAKNIKNRFFVGATSDYRWINHYSVVTAAGNFRGTRWNYVSPLLGIYVKRLIFLVDFQFLGNYNLTYSTDAGTSVTYSSPIGGRASVLFPVGKKGRFHAALFFEQVKFKKQKLSTSTTETTLSPALTLLNAGIGLHYLF